MRSSSVILIAGLFAAGCGSDSPTAPDAPVADATPDAVSPPDTRPTPPACIVPDSTNPAAAPCQECLVSAPLSQSASDCTAEVCGFDLSCCTTGWTERCTELADLRCPDVQCVNAISFGGDGTMTVGWREAATWQGHVVEGNSDLLFDTVAWADYDDDGDADLATATGCYARIFRNDGWDRGELVLTPVLTHEPLADCHLLAGPFYRGTRARWADLDRDGDLDAAFAGDPGVLWVRQTASSFTVAGDIVPPADGPVSDFALVDVDDDGDLDAFVGHAQVDRPPGLYRRDSAGWTADAWVGVTSQTLTVETCDLIGDARPEIVFAGYGNTEAYRLAGGTVGTAVFSPGPGLGLSSGIDFSCGDLDGDAHEEIAYLPGDGTVVIIDTEDGVAWSSVDDLDPDLMATNRGVDVGDLDGDGDLDLVVSISRPTPEASDVPFVILRNVGTGGDLAFTLEPGVDLSLDHEATHAEMLYLRLPPP